MKPSPSIFDRRNSSCHGDGDVTKDEAIAHWGKNFAKVNATSMFNEVDEDGNESVSWDSTAKVRSWRGHTCPPEASLTAFEGLGLPSAPVNRGPASQMPLRGRGLPASGRPS